MKISGIYKIQSKIRPGRCYIGSSVDIYKRKSDHFNYLKNNKHPNVKLQRHYNKYGKNDLQFSLLLGCEKAALIKNEQYFIDSYNSWFNICPTAGNCLGRKYSLATIEKMRLANTGKIASEETRKKLSLTHKGLMAGRKNPNFGRHLTDKHKNKIREANKRRIISEETRRKMSESQKHIKRKPLSAEHKRRLIESVKGRKQSKEHIRRKVESFMGYRHSQEIKNKLKKIWELRKSKVA